MTKLDVDYIGIDPGLNGAIAIVHGGIATTHKYGDVSLSRIPTINMRRVAKGKTKGRMQYDHQTISDFFRLIANPCTVMIEKQQAYPGQSVTSMSVGCGYCTLKQTLTDFHIPFETVPPKEWQDEFGISTKKAIAAKKGNTKAQAVSICQQLFPDVSLLATKRSKKPHEGFSDALLIAEFGRRQGRALLLTC